MPSAGYRMLPTCVLGKDTRGSTDRWTHRQRGGRHSGGMNKASGESKKLVALSGTIALIAFVLLGALFDGWGWAWVVFLVPGVIRVWQAVGDKESDPSHDGEEAGGVAPPRRYEA